MPGACVLWCFVGEHRECVKSGSADIPCDCALFGSLCRDFAHGELDVSGVGVGVVLGDGDGGALCSFNCHAAGRTRPPRELLSCGVVFGLGRFRRLI